MSVVDVVTHLQIYVEDAAECAHATYADGESFAFFGYEFYDINSPF